MINFLIAVCFLTGTKQKPDWVGQPVDIAPSAYQYRADRRADANPPESWLALLHAAQLPLNQPFDRNIPQIRKVLCGLLWEEIRPVQTLELSWPKGAKHKPSPSDLRIITLLNQGASSSWWNNLQSVELKSAPSVSADGDTYVFPVAQNTCGLVVSLVSGENAKQFNVPEVRVLVPDTWKTMDVEVEWGFDGDKGDNDYSGRIEAYDGRIRHLAPLAGDIQTRVEVPPSWQSSQASTHRRGIQMTLLYMGQSKWRKHQEYITQADDVARTIVTIWTKSGSFSFLAADLENGPILAPEYGFFVRRSSPHVVNAEEKPLRVTPVSLATHMDSIAGSPSLKGWGSNDTPWFGGNPTNETVQPLGVTIPAKAVAMHPGRAVDVVVEWRSPIKGEVSIKGMLTHAQAGGHGVEWWLAHDSPAGRQLLDHGKTDGTGSAFLSSQSKVAVAVGDRLAIIVGPKGDYRSCTTLVDFTISESNGLQRSWNLKRDIGDSPDIANPHPDHLGNADVWRFCSEMPMFRQAGLASEPPFSLASKATSAREFEQDLAKRGLRTIREMTRTHSEQTWQGAVEATRGSDLPPHPLPPPDSMPLMQVQVPSDRLTAQWNLGVWHLLRHCAINPKSGRLWFNDYPYGILAAETYLVLSVLDQMGSHDAAEAGFDQWTSLPMDRNPPGTDPSHAVPAHPVGLFSEGHGSLTYAEGPDGYGGQMDGIHAFGPGSIGWALTQHYWMSGNSAWLKANAARIKANTEWMLRQRQVLSSILPGGNRLWGKGLQPALQVTPDSGGLWMQFYECEGYYWAAVDRLADTLAVVDPAGGRKLKQEAESYRKDLRGAVERSIALSPVVLVRDGTFHSVIPFACYVRGSATNAWGWQREGSGTHVGPLYWDTVQTAAALVSPAGLLSPQDVRVQGYLDVLEDRFLLENRNVGDRDWFQAGWQYQGGLERTANMHLAADDIPVFLRSFLNCYAVDILPKDGYVFNEHAVHGPPDKIFEEAAFLERFRNLLVMEDNQNLWLARGTPRAWLEQGKKIIVKHAPTRFGDVDYEIESDVDHGRILTTVSLPIRNPATQVWLRLRHPHSSLVASVLVNGKVWKDFDAKREVVKLHGLKGIVKVIVHY